MRALALAAAAFVIAAPISLAQPPQQPPPTSQRPTTPPTATPATPATPAAPAAPGEAGPAATTPATPATPATPSAQASTQASVEPQGCRTRKPVGEACACLSDTSRVGTSTEHPAGHNVCVRPE